MVKSELVDRLALRHGLPKRRDAEQTVDAILNAILQALVRGRRVELRGFGTFSVKIRPPRIGRNPRYGTIVQLGERKLAHFRCGKELHERLNGDVRQGEVPKVIGTVE